MAECSAMTQTLFGNHLDIHSGGFDLKFPHHTNEIAQSESYNQCEHHGWCSHWLHTGQLFIDGLKMSKSLKNFIKIKDYLTNNEISNQPAKDFRIFLLQHKYSSELHFSNNRIHEAMVYRQKIDNFLAMVSTLEHSHKQRYKYNAMSLELLRELCEVKAKVILALSDDINTPLALGLISDLVGKAVVYLHQFAATESPIEPLIEIRNYVSDFFHKLGVLKDKSNAELLKVI